ncbi:SdrD B-like domain-containing protein [Solobacterium moorei]|uniref:InlB B-repeat-containing protein n=1 Tax=Solobacterium moorei TaxID=102148 RepID=UPI0023F473D3|nr:SdrD B-like domain-containing protein [Solobacterium moorei]
MKKKTPKRATRNFKTFITSLLVIFSMVSQYTLATYAETANDTDVSTISKPIDAETDEASADQSETTNVIEKNETAIGDSLDAKSSSDEVNEASEKTSAPDNQPSTKEENTDKVEESGNDDIQAVQNTPQYMEAGSFEGDISGIFTIKAEYSENTFPLSTTLQVSSDLSTDRMELAKEAFIKQSGKTEEEISIKNIYGMNISFRNQWDNNEVEPAKDKQVKITLTRKDGEKLPEGEQYQLVHYTDGKMEKVDLKVNEEGQITFTASSFSPFYLGVLGSPIPPSITNVPLTVDCKMLNDVGKDSEGVYHYQVNPGTNGVFNITIPKEAFHGGDFRLTATLPKGMKFDQAGLDHLKDKTEVKSVEYDPNDLTSVTVTFKGDAGALDNLATALAVNTDINYMSTDDLDNIIKNGIPKETICFRLLDSNGNLMGENKNYVVSPQTGNSEKINATSIFDTDTANVTISNDINNSVEKGWYFRDHLYPLAKLDIPSAGTDDNKLIRIKQVKVYRPKGLEDLCWPDSLDVENGNVVGGGSFKKVNTTPQVDANGTYDVFEYDLEADSKVNDSRFQGLTYNRDQLKKIRAIWKFKEGAFLPSGTLCEAADTEITFESEGGKEIVKSVTGTKMKVSKGVYDDRFKVTPRPNFKKDSANIEEVIPGHSKSEQKFVEVYNYRYLSNYDANGDLVMSEGEYTETYRFPYEIRPTSFKRSDSYGSGSKLKNIILTVVKADGSTVTKAIDENDIRYSSDGTDFSFAKYLEDGDRVSEVKIEWSALTNSSGGGKTPGTFNYAVARTHADGTPLVKDELIQIGYHAEHPKKDSAPYTYDTDTDTDYLYVKVGEEKCNEFMEQDYTGTKDVYFFGQKDEAKFWYNEPNAGAIYFKGDETNYRSTYTNPVITIRARANNIVGIEEPISYIKAITLSKRMKGWKVVYSTYNKATGVTKNDQEYTVMNMDPNGSGAVISRETLGLDENEYFTSLQLKYDGVFHLEYDSDIDFLYNHQIEFRMVRILGDASRNKSLYHNQDVKVNGPETNRGQIYFDGYFKCDDPCSGTVYTDPNGIESKVGSGSGDGMALRYKPQGERWTLKSTDFESDDRTVVAYQGGIATAEESEDTTHMFMEKSGVFNGGFRAERKDLLNDERSSTGNAPMDVPEAVYVELKDDEFDVASVVSEVTRKYGYSNGYNLSAEDISVVHANGKRYLKISSGGSLSHFDKLQGSLEYELGKINLQVWNGATLGDHHPFGKVYYDVSGLLTKYDGSEAAAYKKYEFEGAVPDVDDIRKTGDTTTPTLFEVGDMSKFTVRVLQHVLNGVQLYPGKNNIVDRNGPVTFLAREKENLMVSEQVHIPGSLNEGEVVVKLPEKGNQINVTSFDSEGNEIKTSKTCDFTMRLTGPAKSNHISGLGSTDTVTYTYSKDGQNYVDESAISSADWKDYRYIKVKIVHQPNPGSDANIDVNIPVNAEDTPAKADDLSSYITGTYTFTTGSEVLSANTSSAQYIWKPYTLKGKLWWDKNEDGVVDADEPAVENTDIVMNLEDANGNVVGSTSGEEGIIDGHGNFSIRTNTQSTSYSVQGTLPAGVKATKQTGTGDPTVSDTDSDFDRTTVKTATFNGFDAAGNAQNVAAGLIKLPELNLTLQMIHVTESPSAFNQNASSENPNNLKPALTYVPVSEDILDSDASGKVTPKQTGLVKDIQVSTANTLGDVVEGKFNAAVYANVLYKNDTAGVTGDAPVDTTPYYPSIDDSNTDRVTVLGAGTMKKTGYRLVGWKDEDGKVYKANDTFKTGIVKKDITLTAVWEPIQYKVTYVIEGPDGSQILVPASETHIYEDVVTVADNPKLEGYHFSGWASEDAYVQAGQTFSMPDHDVVIKGKFIQNSTPKTSDSLHVKKYLGMLMISMMISMICMLIGAVFGKNRLIVKPARDVISMNRINPDVFEDNSQQGVNESIIENYHKEAEQKRNKNLKNNKLRL